MLESVCLVPTQKLSDEQALNHAIIQGYSQMQARNAPYIDEACWLELEQYGKSSDACKKQFEELKFYCDLMSYYGYYDPVCIDTIERYATYSSEIDQSPVTMKSAERPTVDNSCWEQL